jgi:hypothetical protein
MGFEPATPTLAKELRPSTAVRLYSSCLVRAQGALSRTAADRSERPRTEEIGASNGARSRRMEQRIMSHTASVLPCPCGAAEVLPGTGQEPLLGPFVMFCVDLCVPVR